MMKKNNDLYFEWLTNIVCKDLFSKSISYNKLLSYLHSVEFTFIIPRDINRAKDGIDLRYRYHLETGSPYNRDEPCTVLEMMVALTLRCEETIMDNPSYGDRTSQWFWAMIKNLGLSSMTDREYDEKYVEQVIHNLLERNYEPDGRGGLFRIKNCDLDLRDVEIWYQLCGYLDQFV